MNPFSWSLDEQLAFWLAVVSGAALGDVVGYFVYLAASGAQADPFGLWMLYFGFWWAVVGGAIGTGVVYFLTKI